MPNKTVAIKLLFLLLAIGHAYTPAFSQEATEATTEEKTSSDLGSRTVDLEYYEPYRGMTIRNISVKVLKPGGTSLDMAKLDTVAEKKLFINKIHSGSNEKVISNLLLFHEGDPLEPEKIVDYIRVLREKSAYNDAMVFVTPVDGSNEVDLNVYVQDKFVLGLGGGLESNAAYIKLSFGNFLKLGHRVSIAGQFNYDLENPFTVRGKYKVENVFNSRIDVVAKYSIDKKYKEFGFEAEKEFQSITDPWAGRLETYWNYNRVDVKEQNLWNQTLNFNYQDIWIARAFGAKFLGDNAKYARLITSVRAYRHIYSESPYTENLDQFKNNGYVLGSVGIANLDYYENRGIYYLNKTEYLPKGVNFTLISGFNYQEVYREHIYAGFRVNYGHFFKKGGYLFAELSNGNYINKQGYDKGVVKLDMQYFTNPLRIGKYSIRQFVNISSKLGFNRPKDQAFKFYQEDGVRGLKSESLIGMKGINVNLETAVTSPFKVIGFRSQVFVFSNCAVVGKSDAIQNLVTSAVHKGVGIGLRLAHKKLGINFVEFSFTYYPNSYSDADFYDYWMDTGNQREIDDYNLYSPKVISTD